MKELTSIEQLKNVIQESHSNKIAIFKHSTSCGISRMVLKTFEKDIVNIKLEGTQVYYLDLLAHRDVSNAIASTLDIVHESPQLLIIENGIAVYNASHSEIDAQSLVK